MKRRQFIQQATAAFGASALGVTRAAVLAAAALLFAPLGVRARHWLPVPALRKIFGAFIGLVGLKMLGVFPL